MSSSQITQKVIVYILLIVLSLAACAPLDGGLPSGESPGPSTTDPVAGTAPDTGTGPHTGTGGDTARPDEADGGWIDWDGKAGWTSSERRASSEAGEEVVLEKEALAVAEAPRSMAAADAPAAEGAAPMATPSPMPTGVAVQNQSPLRAGEVDDNAEWDEYLLYRLDYAGPWVHDRDVSERYIITVNDQGGRPLLDASVTVYAGNEPVFSGRTYASGQVLFFPKALGVSDEVTSFRVAAEKDDARGEATLARGETYQLSLNLAHAGRGPDEPVNLDVLFLIDSTGSMADEIDKLQESIREIAARIDRLPGQPRARFAMTPVREPHFRFHTRRERFPRGVGRSRGGGGWRLPRVLE